MTAELAQARLAVWSAAKKPMIRMAGKAVLMVLPILISVKTGRAIHQVEETPRCDSHVTAIL